MIGPGVPPLQKGHGIRGWEGTWDQRLGYHPSPGGEQTENITSCRDALGQALRRLPTLLESTPPTGRLLHILSLNT